MFLMNYTWPYIAYAVSKFSIYTHNPCSEHWNSLFQLQRYLTVTMNWCLNFIKLLAVLECYCDANWVTRNDEVSSTSCYVFTFDPGFISLKSSKQTSIERSTMESKLIFVELAGKDAKWLRNLLMDMTLKGREASPVYLHSTL